MVDGDNLVSSRCKLGVDGALDSLLDNLRPFLTAQLDILLVDWLAVGLAALKHERPVGSTLFLCTRHVLAITLQHNLVLSTLDLQKRSVLCGSGRPDGASTDHLTCTSALSFLCFWLGNNQKEVDGGLYSRMICANKSSH